MVGFRCVIVVPSRVGYTIIVSVIGGSSSLGVCGLDVASRLNFEFVPSRNRGMIVVVLRDMRSSSLFRIVLLLSGILLVGIAWVVPVLKFYFEFLVFTA